MLFSYFFIPFNNIRLVWIAISGLTIIAFVKDYRGLTLQLKSLLASRWSVLSSLLIVASFLTLSIQGGLLDRLADGWWHMAYANQIVIEGNVWISQHPLVGRELGSSKFLYPPVWHATLALLSSGLGESLPAIWHSVAAPLAAFTCLSFLLLCFSLTASRSISFFSLFLFLFLVGGLNTYLRILPWPANIAYIGLYFAISETFRISNQLFNQSKESTRRLSHIGSIGILAHLFGLGGIGVLLIGLHGVEAVLYFLSIGAYFFGLFVAKKRSSNTQLAIDQRFVFWLSVVIVVTGFFGGLFFLKGYLIELASLPRAKAPYLNFVVPVVLAGFLLLLAKMKPSRGANNEAGVACKKSWLLVGIFAIFLISITDFSHIAALFSGEEHGRHVPRAFQDRFGNRVWLPWWDHQLRGSLLFSGVVGIFCAILNYTKEQNRATIFILSNTILAVVVLTSPYLFSFFSFLIPLGSTYRIHLLLFTPIPIAIFFAYIFSNDSPPK